MGYVWNSDRQLLVCPDSTHIILLGLSASRGHCVHGLIPSLAPLQNLLCWFLPIIGDSWRAIITDSLDFILEVTWTLVVGFILQ